MSYYRRLPFDVRVAMWVDEHPRFMKRSGVAACAASAAAMVFWLVMA